MEDLEKRVELALKSQEPIPRQQVRDWIRKSESVELDAMLYRLTRDAWNRIEPNLEHGETCALIQRYLLRCIREDPKGGVALTRYQAAWELEAWVDHLAGLEVAQETLPGVVAAVTDLFLNSNDQIREAIETGFLEHVLEQRPLRHLFADWAYDERLQDAWRRALAWGEANPNVMKRLRSWLGAIQSDEE